MTFQIHALPAAPFAPLFDLSDADLAAQGARRMVVDACPGTPCRVSLQDATPGETVLLLNHTHLDAPSPYRASHAIYVRKDAAQAQPAPDTVPEVITSRLISVRLFDAQDMMITAEVVPGAQVADALTRAFAQAEVAYVHLHNAKQGCFAAAVARTA